MSNYFPSVPGDLQVASLSYLAILPTVALQPGSVLDFDNGYVQSTLTYTVPNMGAAFTFITPGSFGTFDQAEFEGLFTEAVYTVCGVLAGMSGLPLAQVAGQVEVRRNWTWADAGGYLLSWQDLMPWPYPFDAEAATAAEAGRT